MTFVMKFLKRYVEAYRNRLFTIANLDESRTRGKGIVKRELTPNVTYMIERDDTIECSYISEYECSVYDGSNTEVDGDLRRVQSNTRSGNHVNMSTTSSDATHDKVENPYEEFQNCLHTFLYGESVEVEDEPNPEIKLHDKEYVKMDYLRQYVIGSYFHAELFNNKSGVHLPQPEYMHRGHCLLNITRDYMQTAVNAFAIFLYGTINDIKQLPADYVLRSSKTISMMKIAREKLATTWNVVKGNRKTEEIPYETLEMYRPLFRYINGKEMARLNLSDDRILTYIGTHADLDRHQVGVIASKYIEVNKQWSKPKYLNLMNNLLCGVPMTFMRNLSENTYLQLSQQIFYHIRACDPLQRRFFLSMMTRTQALGKSYSWNARDVSRLGVLLAEVDGQDLSFIKPEAVAGISAQVMELMSVDHLKYLTVTQLEQLTRKPLNIYIRKLKFHEEEMQLYGTAFKKKSNLILYTVIGIFVVKTTDL